MSERVCAALLCASLVGLTACALAPRAQRAAIGGGEATTSDTAVVAIVTTGTSCAEPPSVTCSGLLIAPRVVLTAAHCTGDFVRATQVGVFFGDAIGGAGSIVGIDDFRLDPSFDEATGEHDLALLLLAQDAPVSPLTLVDHDASLVAIGADVRVVGFGVTDGTAAGDETAGTRRSGVMRVSAVGASDLTTEPGPASSCAGDSGGPVFAQLGGEEVVVGLTSGGDRTCMVSARNARIDVRMEAFVRPALAELSALSRDRLASDATLAGLCEMRCTDSLECPVGMTCDVGVDGLSYCLVAALGPSRYEGECASDVECRGRPCLHVASAARCLCADPCVDIPLPGDSGTPPRRDAGGSVSPSEPTCGCRAPGAPQRAMPALALVMLGLLVSGTRRRTRAR